VSLVALVARVVGLTLLSLRSRSIFSSPGPPEFSVIVGNGIPAFKSELKVAPGTGLCPFDLPL